MQDRITEQVASIVQPKVEQAEIDRARRKRPDELDAYDLLLRALPKLYSRHMSDNVEVARLLTQAVTIDPSFAPALAELAFTLDARVSMGWVPFSDDDRRSAIDYAKRAILEAGGDARVLGTASIVLMHCAKDYEQAMQLARTAVETNPNSLQVMSCASVVQLHCGDVAASLAFSRRAIELSPADPGSHWTLTAIAHAHMALGEFAEALEWAERSRVINPEYDPTFWMLIAGNAQLGRMDEARRWLASFRHAHPDLTVARLKAAQPDRHPDRMAAILEGLRLAGLPER